MKHKSKPGAGRLVPNFTVIFVVLTLLGLFACIFVIRVLELTVELQKGQVQISRASDEAAEFVELSGESGTAITVITSHSPLAAPSKTATPLPTPIPKQLGLDGTPTDAQVESDVQGLNVTVTADLILLATTNSTLTPIITATEILAPDDPAITPTSTAVIVLPPPAMVLLNAHLNAPEERSNVRLLQWQWLGQKADLPEGWFYIVRFLDGRNSLQPYFMKQIDEGTTEPIQFDGDKFTFRWDIFTLPADRNSCQPFWQVALASNDPDCTLGTIDNEICLLTEFSKPQNIGAINPAAAGICTVSGR